jgi:hypothetical protein
MRDKILLYFFTGSFIFPVHGVRALISRSHHFLADLQIKVRKFANASSLGIAFTRRVSAIMCISRNVFLHLSLHFAT